MPRSFRLPPSVPAHGASTKEGRRKPLPPPCARHSPPQRHAPCVLFARSRNSFQGLAREPAGAERKKPPTFTENQPCMHIPAIPALQHESPACKADARSPLRARTQWAANAFGADSVHDRSAHRTCARQLQRLRPNVAPSFRPARRIPRPALARESRCIKLS